MSSRAQNDILLYALLGRKITPAPSHKKTVSSRRERNKEYAKHWLFECPHAAKTGKIPCGCEQRTRVDKGKSSKKS